MDYCNSVLYGICEVHLRPLLSVLNAAAKLVNGKRKFDHINGAMRGELHWLPVRRHVLFKLCTLISKCLHRSAPSYLTDMCIRVSMTTGQSRLYGRMRIPRCRLSRYGSRSFAVSVPAAWNSLSAAVRDLSLSHSCFCSRLRTELFKEPYLPLARS